MADRILKCCVKCNANKPVSEFYLHSNGAHRNACKTCMNQRHKSYVAENNDRVSAYKRGWSDANKPNRRATYATNDISRALYVARALIWAKSNPEKRSAIAQNYKHRRRAQEDGGISSADLMAWKREQIKVCYWCGQKCAKTATVDHYKPLAKGGNHEASNFVIACRTCNVSKNAKDPYEFAQSLGRLF